MPRGSNPKQKLACGVNQQQYTFLLQWFLTADLHHSRKAAGYRSAAGCYQILKSERGKRVLQMFEGGELLPGEVDQTRRKAIEELKSIAFARFSGVMKPATIMTDDGPVSTMVLADADEWAIGTDAAIQRIKFHPADKGGGIQEVSFYSKLEAMKQLAPLIGADIDTPGALAGEIAQHNPVRKMVRVLAATDVTEDTE